MITKIIKGEKSVSSIAFYIENESYIHILGIHFENSYIPCTKFSTRSEYKTLEYKKILSVDIFIILMKII